MTGIKLCCCMSLLSWQLQVCHLCNQLAPLCVHNYILPPLTSPHPPVPPPSLLFCHPNLTADAGDRAIMSVAPRLAMALSCPLLTCSTGVREAPQLRVT